MLVVMLVLYNTLITNYLHMFSRSRSHASQYIIALHES